MKLDLYLAQTTELQKIASRLLEGLPTIEKWVFRVLLSVLAYFVVGKLIKKVCNFLKTALQTAGVEVGATQLDRKSTRLNSSHIEESRMPSSA